MNGAEAPRKSYNREKFTPGYHVCKVVNIREESGFHGTFFKIDLEVVEGPTGVGEERTWMINPDNAKGSAKMPVAKARALDIGKIQAAVAACYGYTAANAGMVDDAGYRAALAKEDGTRSPLVGRLLVVKAVKYKEDGIFLEFEPHPSAIQAASSPTPSVPTAPSAPAKAFPPAGWTQHPENADYYYNGSQVLSTAQLQAL